VDQGPHTDTLRLQRLLVHDQLLGSNLVAHVNTPTRDLAKARTFDPKWPSLTSYSYFAIIELDCDDNCLNRYLLIQVRELQNERESDRNSERVTLSAVRIHPAPWH